MTQQNLTGKDLQEIGYPEAPVISIVLETLGKNFIGIEKVDQLFLLKDLLTNSEAYKNHETLSAVATELIRWRSIISKIELNDFKVPFDVFGREHIEDGAFAQMDQAARLPISVRGALMPDAHAGYGLPIGGVLATENAVIPYGVGVDIGCRMCLSIFDIDIKEITDKQSQFAREINEATLFGSGRHFDKLASNEVLDRSEFDTIPLLKSLQSKAAKQLGSSGSGNHFVEFGIIEMPEADAILGISAGSYIGLLSHSGSRGLGANIANHYTKIAKQKRVLPEEASNLAWLSLDEQEGIEYWMAMNLAGDYASACHHVIHEKIARQLGRQPIKMVENHHNFAWKEMHDGRELIVHRKGATPAGKDVLGVIPGSMTAPGYVVKGKGSIESLSSAAHGAGRKMSRTNALKIMNHQLLKETLATAGVKLLDGGLDEAPQAYKDINVVMNYQTELVDIVGKFIPKIVKMDGTPPKKWRNKKAQESVDGE
jgi:tRNA-splicing ligase RtcB (3'-phosphate/5'-hydroxy nucleic acid ligase)